MLCEGCWERTYLESVRLVMVSPLALRSEGLSHNDDNDEYGYSWREGEDQGHAAKPCRERERRLM